MSDKKSESSSPPKKIGVTVSTPCFGGMICEGYFHSILKTSAIFNAQPGWRLYINSMGNESLITRARNTLVAQLLDM